MEVSSETFQRSRPSHEQHSHSSRQAHSPRSERLQRRSQFRFALPARNVRLARHLRAGRPTSTAGGNPLASSFQPHGRSLARSGGRLAAAAFATAGASMGRMATGIATIRPACCSIRRRRCFPTAPSGRARARPIRNGRAGAASISAARATIGATMRRRWSRLEDSIVYELHVRGFTCHPSSGVAKPGTFAGTDREDSLFAMAGRHRRRTCCRSTSSTSAIARSRNPLTGERNRKLLGLQHASPSPLRRPLTPLPRTSMARSPNSATWSKPSTPPASKSWLDVVFNHTGEGDDRGRTYSFRGLDNSLYYLLDARRPLPELLPVAATRSIATIPSSAT